MVDAQVGTNARLRPMWLSWTLLAVAVSVASTSAILVRYATDADALAISLWRCAAGALLIAPFAVRHLRDVVARDLVAPAVAGVFLALHFATWIASLDLTTIAASVLLVSTSPVFVALAARAIFGDRLASSGWMGIAVALAGTAAIVGVRLDGSTLSGNVLALIGGAAGGGYLLAGQIARRGMGIAEYATITYSVAAVVLLPFCVALTVDLGGYDATTWLALAGIVIGPQLMGHTVINLVLRDIDSTSVSATVMAEPVIAVTLAYVLFSEIPPSGVYAGGAAILTGIFLVSRARREPVVISE